MRLLVLGGTRFLGRAIVDDAITRGYDVTTFTRGLSGQPRPGAEALHGDRTSTDDLRKLADREWDAVIDTSTIAPADVLASARLLAGRVGHYTYVSTISVYQDRPTLAITEESPVRECPPDAPGTAESLGYGELKAGAERAVAEAFGGRALLARPGLILGPHENVGRLPWWLARLVRGGTVLAPGSPDQPVRFTDVRDLAAWLVENTLRRTAGPVNIPGPTGHTLGGLLTECVRATAPERVADPDLRWVPDDALLAAGVSPWMELPLWAPDIPDLHGVWQVSGDRAEATGIRYRSLSETVHDTWRWLRQEAAAQGRPAWDHDFDRRPGIGLDPVKERQILASLSVD